MSKAGVKKPARVAGLGCLLAVPSPAVAQTFLGSVLDDENEEPVVTALVRLITAAGEEQVIEAPAPGVYRLKAARLGYEIM